MVEVEDDMDLGINAEEHVCQSCGMPLNDEDLPEGSEQGDFCHYCMSHGEFSLSKEEVRKKLAGEIAKSENVSMDQGFDMADERMNVLQRWQ